MTFTVIGRCARTGNLGIGIATYSLAVGATCPAVAQGCGAVSTQAFTNPDLGPAAAAMLHRGDEPPEILVALRKLDDWYEYRQIGVMGQSGAAAVHSGERIRRWAGHIIGDGLIAMGNGLAGPRVIERMARAFEVGASAGLAERLLSALEAGRDAGGQEPAPGAHLPERSAVLLVYGGGEVPFWDLRVDLHDDAVTELRRVYGLYAIYAPYYEQRQRDPAHLQAQEEWGRENAPDPGREG